MHRNSPAGHPTTYKFTVRGFGLRKFFKRSRRAGWVVLASLGVGLTSLYLVGQSAPAAPPAQSTPASAPDKTSQKQKDDGIPDAPSAVQPPQPAPENPLPAAPNPQEQAPQTPPSFGNEAPAGSAPEAQRPNPATPPPLNIRTVPEGGATNDQASAQDQLFRITKNVNQVMVPVTVKDESGHLVNGLVAEDFTVMEGGKKQKLNFFTSDPFALSAAVILDLGM